MTYEELNRYFYIKKRIKTINAELAQISYLSATLNDGMPHGSNVGDPVHAAAMKLDKIKKKLQFQACRATDELDKLTDYIERIEDIEMQEIISQRFILCKSYEAIGEDLFMHFSTVREKLYKFLGKAENPQNPQ